MTTKLCHDCCGSAFRIHPFSEGTCDSCHAVGLVVTFQKIPPLGSPEFSRQYGPLIRALADR